MIPEPAAKFLSASWNRAQTLSERIALLNTIDDDRLQSLCDPERGDKRWRRWLEQPQFSDQALLARRIADLGLDEQRLRLILGLPDQFLGEEQGATTPWLSRLSAAFTRQPSSYVEIFPGEEELAFLELVQSMVDQACDQLAEGVRNVGQQYPHLPIDPQTIEEVLLANLVNPLLMRLSRTMVLELNVARLQGELAGDTPAERFQSFIDSLNGEEKGPAILAEYPVLARQLMLCIEQWQAVNLEFLARLGRDWPLICRHFSPGEDPGPLQELVGGAGDTHRGGRSVMIARFQSGFRIVYKPKSMAVDIHFQELLRWLNDRGAQPLLRPLHILDRGEYGWVEYIAYEACQSEAEIGRFYRRLGSYLALLHAINGSDFHLENLIACGEQPMLIDLETLFNPDFERFDRDDAMDLAGRAMIQSVLAVGMLPQRIWSGAEYGGIDISGFGGEEGQLSPDRLPRTAAAGTDQMHFQRERVPLEREANRPMLHGQEASALHYMPQVLRGFRDMYRLLMHNRADLLAAGGPIAAFANDEVRVLMRPTRTYDQLLFESFHPDMLRDALDRGLLLDRLWLTAGQRPFMAGLVAIEQADMLQGDIPVFTTRPESTTLYSAAGEPIDGILTEAGMAITRERIHNLSEDGLRRQEWFIRASLATLQPYTFGAEFDILDRPETLSEEPVQERATLPALAAEAADYLVETAVRSDNDVTWIGLELLAEESWDISPAGMDLYNGIPGIALFLAYAGTILDDQRYSDLARRTLPSLRRYIDEVGDDLPGIGAFAGWGGILYYATHLSVLWDEPDLRQMAGQMVDMIGRWIAQDEAYSVIDGAAGAIAALLAWHEVRPQEKTLATALACGEHLLAQAQPFGQGLAWPTPLFGPKPLAGFGHGVAGIAWALSRLAAATGQERFAAAAQQALVYERGLFSVEAENWPDLRQNRDGNADEAPRYPAAWSFGAPGIGLARLQMWQAAPDDLLRQEIHIALETTLAHGFGASHSLSHGDLGSSELFLQAGRLGGFAETADYFERIQGLIVRNIARDGRLCGGPAGVELPGLMLGAAGIGYQLLRLAYPQRLPSLLTLAPPTLNP